jgi:hypothetical protein
VGRWRDRPGRHPHGCWRWACRPALNAPIPETRFGVFRM